mmetsp:Transcript_54765/g.138761  ORF Transcript_54765/g.138761 Transcript_54765/m.138761 type:complete len:295 (-) Transcript_54765:186-1070(-)
MNLALLPVSSNHSVYQGLMTGCRNTTSIAHNPTDHTSMSRETWVVSCSSKANLATSGAMYIGVMHISSTRMIVPDGRAPSKSTSFQNLPKSTMFAGLMSMCTKPAACRPHTIETSDHWICRNSSTDNILPSAACSSRVSSRLSPPSSKTMNNFSSSGSMPGALACSEFPSTCTKHCEVSMLCSTDVSNSWDVLLEMSSSIISASKDLRRCCRAGRGFADDGGGFLAATGCSSRPKPASAMTCMVLRVSLKCVIQACQSSSAGLHLYIFTATSRLHVLSKPLYTLENEPSPSMWS